MNTNILPTILQGYKEPLNHDLSITSMYGNSTTSLGSRDSISEEIFPNILTVWETSPQFATTSSEVTVQSSKVSLSLLFSRLNNAVSHSHSP